MELPIYYCGIDPELNSDIEVSFVSLVDRPAIARNFLTFSEQEKRFAFTLNDDKKIIAGPAMIADLPIYRSENGHEYYTVFDANAISTIAQKFFKKGYNQKFNLQHADNSEQTGVTIYQSWITNQDYGISPLKGYEDVPDGSWFIAAKVDDDGLWQRIKDGEFRGFSVEGIFTYKEKDVKRTPEQLYAELEKIMSEIKDLN